LGEFWWNLGVLGKKKFNLEPVRKIQKYLKQKRLNYDDLLLQEFSRFLEPKSGSPVLEMPEILREITDKRAEIEKQRKLRLKVPRVPKRTPSKRKKTPIMLHQHQRNSSQIMKQLPTLNYLKKQAQMFWIKLCRKSWK